ncbi:hypothetical protein [Hymenobacter sp. BRD67]|uniref:hypothetical protein n=1 Tax=Hymenobacter sp. BRD67 TaxID=2675877 RepID=UPI00156302EE|nr:hypothetical protein [Hymenobacter sp. BRD67]QKG52825.1 hypothetical protein GKZ67_09700 [Hymenobacter sp. BRD67]
MVLILLVAGPARADPAPADTLRPEPLFARRRLVVQYDSRYSIINSHFCTINGLKLGLEWRGRVRTGAAVYFLSSGIPTVRELPDNAADAANAQLRFRYLALYGEYAILENPRWELSGSLQAGLGSAYVLYQNEDNVSDTTPRDLIGLLEPSVAAQMRLFPWVSLGAGAGWRQPVFVPQPIRRELSGPVFYLRAKVLLGPLVRTVWQHKPLFTQEGLQVQPQRHHRR